MKIVCTLKREGGTKVDNLFGKNYHFKPEGAGEEARHVCEVDDPAAIARFLKVKGYEKYDPNEDTPTVPKGTPTVQEFAKLKAGNKPEVTQSEEISDDDAQKGPPVIIEGGSGPINLTEMDLDALKVFAREEFKINIHHKWKRATIIAKVVEAMRVANGEESDE